MSFCGSLPKYLECSLASSYGELLPKYTASGEDEAKTPFAMTVFRMMKSEYAIVYVFYFARCWPSARSLFFQDNL